MSSTQTDKEDLLEVSIRTSLWKTVLLAGADRRVTITIIGSSMVLVLLSRFSFWPCVTAISLGTIGQLVGIRIATADPQMIDVYLRHINFKRIYLGRPDIGSKVKKPNPSIPKV